MPLNHTSQYAELTDEQCKLIGKIVVEWSNIEFLQKTILSRLLFTPDYLSRTYTDLIIAVKIQDAIREAVELHLYRYVCKIIKKELLDEIIQVNDKVTLSRANRNKFAHFCWSRSSDNEIFGTSFSAGLPHSRKHEKSYLKIKTKDIEKLYKESYCLVTCLSNIIEKLPEVKEEDLLKKIKGEQVNSKVRHHKN
jgi:hypothetical protein